MFWAFVVVVLLILVAVGAVIAIYNGLVAD